MMSNQYTYLETLIELQEPNRLPYSQGDDFLWSFKVQCVTGPLATPTPSTLKPPQAWGLTAFATFIPIGRLAILILIVTTGRSNL